MTDNKKVQQVEKHYEKRWLEAKHEIIKDVGPVVDVLLNVHLRCEELAEKYNVNLNKLTQWCMEQLPITQVCTGDEDTEDYDE